MDGGEVTLPGPCRSHYVGSSLRRGKDIDHLARLRAFADGFELVVGEQVVTFVDRTVVLIRGSANNLARSIDILGMIAEVRMPKATAAFFSDMNAIEQTEWVNDLLARTQVPPGDAPSICLFDTGLNHAHPLIASVAQPTDLHTYKPAWESTMVQDMERPWLGLLPTAT